VKTEIMDIDKIKDYFSNLSSASQESLLYELSLVKDNFDFNLLIA
jgi:hypothetical protein